jgi:branched-chain amino acid transport system ATP-binding protein
MADTFTRSVVEARGLTVDYAGNRALSLDHLALLPGTITGVVGANGAGKSTLVGALLGWSRGRPRVAGEVRLDGRNVSALAPEQRARLGLLLVPEGKGVFNALTVEENLRAVPPPASEEGRHLFGVDEIYSLFPRLAERRQHPGSALSGGERQMLAISRALRAAPRALLLDEPSIGLAPRLVIVLLETVRRLVDSGLTVLLVEQNVRAAVDVVDRMLLLERGRVVVEGPVGEMRDDPRILEAYLGEVQA